MTKPVNYTVGTCPYCKCINVEYGEEYIDGEVVVYPFKCQGCGRMSEEIYYLEYDSTEGLE